MPLQWRILSTIFVTIANFDNWRSINVIPSITNEYRLREVRLQANAQFEKYQRLHSKIKKLEETPHTYPPNTCVLMSDSILNYVIGSDLSNDPSIKVRKFPRVTVKDLRHHALLIICKHPKFLIIHVRTNNAVKLPSRDNVNKLLQLKFFIQENLSDAKITISAITLKSDDSKAALTVWQLTNHLINLKIDILDSRDITSKHLSQISLHLNQFGSNLLTKTLFLSYENFENL